MTTDVVPWPPHANVHCACGLTHKLALIYTHTYPHIPKFISK